MQTPKRNSQRISISYLTLMLVDLVNQWNKPLILRNKSNRNSYLLIKERAIGRGALMITLITLLSKMLTKWYQLQRQYKLNSQKTSILILQKLKYNRNREKPQKHFLFLILSCNGKALVDPLTMQLSFNNNTKQTMERLMPQCSTTTIICWWSRLRVAIRMTLLMYWISNRLSSLPSNIPKKQLPWPLLGIN
jgi:hypothetical protein